MLQEIINPDAFRESSLFLTKAHLLTLFVFFLSVFWLFFHRRKTYMKHMRWVLFAALVLTEIGLVSWTVYHGMWSVKYNLPLNLCTISLYLSAVMLITKSHTLFEILYFFGIGGALQALLTPDLFYTFPHFRFLHFFIAHIAIILSILYMILFYRYTVTFRSFIKSFLVLNVLAFIVYLANIVTGGNYMFLARKPSGPSMLDFLGPHPWYILSLEAIAFFMFLLLYLPFLFLNKKSGRRTFSDVRTGLNRRR